MTTICKGIGFIRAHLRFECLYIWPFYTVLEERQILSDWTTSMFFDLVAIDKTAEKLSVDETAEELSVDETTE